MPKLTYNKAYKSQVDTYISEAQEAFYVEGDEEEQEKEASLMRQAKPADMTKAEEKYWKEAEKAAKKSYDPEEEPDLFYGTTTDIFKKKVKKHLGYNPFKKKKKKKSHPYYDLIRRSLLKRLKKTAVEVDPRAQQLTDYQLENRLRALYDRIAIGQERVEEIEQKLEQLQQAPGTTLGPSMQEQAQFLARSLEKQRTDVQKSQLMFQWLQNEYARRVGEQWQVPGTPGEVRPPQPVGIEEEKERRPQREERKPEMYGAQRDGRQFVSAQELEYDPETGWRLSPQELMSRVATQILRELQATESDEPIVHKEREQVSARRPMSFKRWLERNLYGPEGARTSPVEEIERLINNPEDPAAREAAQEKYKEYKQTIEQARVRERDYTIDPVSIRAMVGFLFDPERNIQNFVRPGFKYLNQMGEQADQAVMQQLEPVAREFQTYGRALETILEEVRPLAGRPVGAQAKMEAAQKMDQILNMMADRIKNAIKRVAKNINPTEAVNPRVIMREKGEEMAAPGGARLRRKEKVAPPSYDEPPMREGRGEGELAKGSEGYVWRWNAQEQEWKPTRKQEEYMPFFGGQQKQQELMGLTPETPSGLPVSGRILDMREWVLENRRDPIIQAWMGDKKNPRLIRSVQEAYKDYVDVQQVEQREVGRVPGSPRGVYRAPAGERKAPQRKLPQFAWRGVNPEGEMASGLIEAENEEAAREQLTEQGVRIEELTFKPRRERRRGQRGRGQPEPGLRQEVEEALSPEEIERQRRMRRSSLEDILTKLAIRRKRRRSKVQLEQEHLPAGAEISRELIPEEYKQRAQRPTEEVYEERMERQKDMAARAKELGLPEPPFVLSEALNQLDDLREKALKAGTAVEQAHGILPGQVREELQQRKKAMEQMQGRWAQLVMRLDAKRQDPETGEMVPIQMSQQERDQLEQEAFRMRQAYEQYAKHFTNLAQDQNVADLLKHQQEISRIANSLEFKLESFKNYLEKAKEMKRQPGADKEKLNDFMERMESMLGRQEKLLDYQIQEGREYLIGPGQESDWRSYTDLPPRGEGEGEKERTPYSARRKRQMHGKI